MPDPLADLAEKAKRATPGPWQLWEVEAWDDGTRRAEIIAPTHSPAAFTYPDGALSWDDAAYIAACSPERILALVERVRELERTDA
jgi:hypothetical protein